MTCEQCRELNVEGSKYCAFCGCILDPALGVFRNFITGATRSEVKRIVKDELKDAKVVETELATAAMTKLAEWTKLFAYFVGIPMTLLFAILAGAGIKNYYDVVNIANDAKKSEKEIANNLVLSKKLTSDSLAEAQAQLDSLKKKSAELDVELANLQKKQEIQALNINELKSAVKNVEFKESSTLTKGLKSKLDIALKAYVEYAAKVGFKGLADGRTYSIKIDETIKDNAYYVKDEGIVISANLAGDPEYLISEFTWMLLNQSNEKIYERFFDEEIGEHLAGFGHGLKFYFPSSYDNNPVVGRAFGALTGRLLEKKKGLFDLSVFKPFEYEREPHALGELWGGAFWEIREKIGSAKADRLFFETWRRLKLPGTPTHAKFFVDAVIETNKDINANGNAKEITEAFTRRNLK